MAKIKPERVRMKEQPPEERRKNFDEVPYGYTPEEAIEEAKRCLQCKKPKCIAGCPVDINIPEFILCIAEGDFRGAINVKECASWGSNTSRWPLGG
jgi:glutamate synthase (NADPH/NADH) small chain